MQGRFWNDFNLTWKGIFLEKKELFVTMMSYKSWIKLDMLHFMTKSVCARKFDDKQAWQKRLDSYGEHMQ